MREFSGADDPGFSSFAQLVGLTRSLNVAVPERQTPTLDNTRIICADADACILAWCALLPPSKKRILKSDGTLDDHLFKANMLIHSHIINLHRVLSNLAYNPVESVARCAPLGPPEGSYTTCSVDTHIHTSKTLISIEKLNELLTLITCLPSQTPFIISMVANTTIAHLSACKYLFRDRELRIAREKIRLSMGVMKALAEYWPLGKRTYLEVGIIAREILCLADGDIGANTGQAPVTYPDMSFDDIQAELDMHDMLNQCTVGEFPGYEDGANTF